MCVYKSDAQVRQLHRLRYAASKVNIILLYIETTCVNVNARVYTREISRKFVHYKIIFISLCSGFRQVYGYAYYSHTNDEVHASAFIL